MKICIFLFNDAGPWIQLSSMRMICIALPRIFAGKMPRPESSRKNWPGRRRGIHPIIQTKVVLLYIKKSETGEVSDRQARTRKPLYCTCTTGPPPNTPTMNQMVTAIMIRTGCWANHPRKLKGAWRGRGRENAVRGQQTRQNLEVDHDGFQVSH